MNHPNKTIPLNSTVLMMQNWLYITPLIPPSLFPVWLTDDTVDDGGRHGGRDAHEHRPRGDLPPPRLQPMAVDVLGSRRGHSLRHVTTRLRRVHVRRRSPGHLQLSQLLWLVEEAHSQRPGGKLSLLWLVEKTYSQCPWDWLSLKSKVFSINSYHM